MCVLHVHLCVHLSYRQDTMVPQRVAKDAGDFIRLATAVTGGQGEATRGDSCVRGDNKLEGSESCLQELSVCCLSPSDDVNNDLMKWCQLYVCLFVCVCLFGCLSAHVFVCELGGYDLCQSVILFV